MQPPSGNPPPPPAVPPPPSVLRDDPPAPSDGPASPVPRHNKRSDLPQESPGRMVLPTNQSIYVTLHDISRGGCCVVRKGVLDLQPEQKVCIEIWREDIQSKASLPATVRWVRHEDEKTLAGLRFVDSSIKTQRIIDQYLQRSFTPEV